MHAVAVPLLAGAAFAAAAAPIFPEIVVARGETPHEWPFSIDEGTLACVRIGATRAVFFSEILTPEEMGEFGNMTLPRTVVVSSNPLALFVSFEDRALYAPFDTLETLVGRLLPFEKMGLELCDRPTEDEVED